MRMRSVTPPSMVVSGCRSFLVSLSLARTLQISHSSLNNHNINYTIKCCSPINTLSPALTSDSESSRSDLTSSPSSSYSTGVVLARTKEFSSIFHGKIRSQLGDVAKKLQFGRSLDTMAAMLASGCRSLGMPMALLRILDISHSALIKYYNKRSLKRCHPRSSHNSALASESSRVYSNNSTTTSSSNGVVFARTKEYCSVFHGKIRIRAQFAACEAPLVGDSMYMPAALAEMANPGVNPFGKHKKDLIGEGEKEMATLTWIEQHGKEPSVAIGLQACQISWDDGDHFYKAGSPWWRCENA
ncbi:hypothetical protein K1719_004675 [Acacia pycnantha]|nr:hypothetical protein K1719_004675 [Acacia pycnantha]